MGQKVDGYRRNVPYGNTSLIKIDGWKIKVNPKGRYGWDIGRIGRNEFEFGTYFSESRRILKEIEEIVKYMGYLSNGRGRKGNKKRGYVIYGEYIEGENKNKTVNVNKDSIRIGLERILIKYEFLIKTKLIINIKDRTSKKKTKNVLYKIITILSSGDYVKRLINKRIVDIESGVDHMNKIRNLEKIIKDLSINKGGIKTVEDTKQGYYGYKIIVKGVLGGSKRKIKYTIMNGKLPIGTKKAFIVKENGVAKTEVGSRGVCIVFTYGRG